MAENVISLEVMERVIHLQDEAFMPPTQSNDGFDFVRISLDDEWIGLTYVVTFDNHETVPVEWDGESVIQIPEPCTRCAGDLRIGIEGFSQDGSKELHTRMMRYGIPVPNKSKDGGTGPNAPTPSIVQQALEATDRANAISERVEGAEAERVATFNANQQERDDAFNAAQTERADKFSEDQQGRSNAFNSDMAEWAQEVSQKVAEAATAALAANNAANNISQRADSGEFNGAPFSISYTPVSVAAMNAIQGAKQGEFAVINSNVEDPDNAKLYMFGNGVWNYMSDLSGATGFGLQGKQGVSLKGVRVINQTQVEVTQYDPMTEQERTYVIGDFAAPLAAGVSGYVDSKWQVVDAMPENPVPGVIYFVRE